MEKCQSMSNVMQGGQQGHQSSTFIRDKSPQKTVVVMSKTSSTKRASLKPKLTQHNRTTKLTPKQKLEKQCASNGGSGYVQQAKQSMSGCKSVSNLERATRSGDVVHGGGDNSNKHIKHSNATS